MEGIIQNLISALGGIPSELIVFIISLFPILELRGGLIAASILNVDVWRAIPICILGNILPIPFILLFIEKMVTFPFRWHSASRYRRMDGRSCCSTVPF